MADETPPPYPSSLGYIFQTGSLGADSLPFQTLVTIDAPTTGSVKHHCIGKEGIYFLSDDFNDTNEIMAHVLPLPGGTTKVTYASARKQTYRWKSKKFVMAGRTTMSAAKIVMDKGCARLKIYVDGCCKYDKVVTTCNPFRLTDQLVGHTFEIELIGTARIYEAHIASTFEELIRARATG